MTEQIEPAPVVPPSRGSTIDLRVAWGFCRYAGRFWRGDSALRAWGITLALGLCLLLSVMITVALNHWNRWFFDALEKKDAAAMPGAILWLLVIVGIMASIGVGIVLARETVQVRWREWLIAELVSHWLKDRRFYHLNATRTEPANPEYRIADDTRWATEPLVDLGIGFILAVFGAAAFISILWSVGGSYQLNVGGGTIAIPAYMVLVALVYGAIASLLMLWIGRPLAGHFYAKNEAEGDFRFALMRLRDSAESVALMHGEKAERRILGHLYSRVVGEWMAIVRRHGVLTWVTNSSGPLKPIVPLLFAAPKYFSGELSLGQVTQLAAAFLEVQIAISWIVDNFNRIAEWYASARRVMDIVEACERVDALHAGEGSQIEIVPAANAGLRMSSADVSDPFGAPLLKDVSLGAAPGESTHVAGETSVGKTTMVRAIAGLWTRGAGRIEVPESGHVMILPQKPYMPLGSLRDALAYPRIGTPPAGGELAAALAMTGLGHLASRLDEIARWDQRLSNGERQRLGVARLIVHRPDVVVLDDALSALDETSQIELIALLRKSLPDAAVLSLSQAQPPPGLYDTSATLERKAGTATIRQTMKERA